MLKSKVQSLRSCSAAFFPQTLSKAPCTPPHRSRVLCLLCLFCCIVLTAVIFQPLLSSQRKGFFSSEQSSISIITFQKRENYRNFYVLKMYHNNVTIHHNRNQRSPQKENCFSLFFSFWGVYKSLNLGIPTSCQQHDCPFLMPVESVSTAVPAYSCKAPVEGD